MSIKRTLVSILPTNLAHIATEDNTHGVWCSMAYTAPYGYMLLNKLKSTQRSEVLTSVETQFSPGQNFYFYPGLPHVRI